MELSKKFDKNALRKLAKAEPTIEDILDACFGYDKNLLRKDKSTVSKALILGCEPVIENRIIDIKFKDGNTLEAKYGIYIIDKKSGKVILECYRDTKTITRNI